MQLVTPAVAVALTVAYPSSTLRPVSCACLAVAVQALLLLLLLLLPRALVQEPATLPPNWTRLTASEFSSAASCGLQHSAVTRCSVAVAAAGRVNSGAWAFAAVLFL